MNARFVHVAFSLEGPAPLDALAKVFNGALDWARYDANCWILYTTTELDVWRDRIRKTPGIKESDSFFIVEFDKSHYSGYMYEWVWTWLNKDRSK